MTTCNYQIVALVNEAPYVAGCDVWNTEEELHAVVRFRPIAPLQGTETRFWDCHYSVKIASSLDFHDLIDDLFYKVGWELCYNLDSDFKLEMDTDLVKEWAKEILFLTYNRFMANENKCQDRLPWNALVDYPGEYLHEILEVLPLNL